LYEFILERDDDNWGLAERALQAIKDAVRSLELSPFSFRKAATDSPFLRELVIPFGGTGYVALFEIDDSETVTILAVRHQRENDYR
jgi:plasmid stabilization system protein ParE